MKKIVYSTSHYLGYKRGLCYENLEEKKHQLKKARGTCSNWEECSGRNQTPFHNQNALFISKWS